MKTKRVITIVFIFLLFVNLVTSAGETLNFTQKSKEAVAYRSDSVSHFKIKDIRQDPFPSNPGEYTDIYIKIDNTGGDLANPNFDLVLKYPFSLDPSSDNSTDLPGISAGEKITFHYRLRVDKNALPGDYEIEFKAFGGADTYYVYYFNIKVDDVTSSFDIALQEVSKDGVSLALSNTGKNTANSITVRIDKQEDFDLLGPSSYIIGNLNAGDYTIVSVQVAPKNIDAVSQFNLKVQIDYTDTIGNRRTVNKELPVVMSQQIKNGFKELKDFALYGANKTESTGISRIYFYVVIAIAFVLIVISFYRKKRYEEDEE